MINVSLVLYHTPVPEVTEIVRLLRQSPLVDKIWLIDNSEKQTEAFISLPVRYVFNNANLGYGAAHNIALRHSLKTSAHYHIVLNTDITFHSDIISQIFDYMETNPNVGQLMPLVFNPDGTQQHVAKLLPTPYDVFMRRFTPDSWNRSHNAIYELHNLPLDRPSNIPNLSGCFMVLRISTLRQVGLFDERYFLYAEDIDLTRRINQTSQTIFYPLVSITHHHRRESYHQFRVMISHIISLSKYFNKYGWFVDQYRRITNKKIKQQLYGGFV